MSDVGGEVKALIKQKIVISLIEMENNIHKLLKLTCTVQFFLCYVHVHRVQLPIHALIRHDTGMSLAYRRAGHTSHHYRVINV